MTLLNYRNWRELRKKSLNCNQRTKEIKTPTWRDVDLRIEWISLGHGDGETLGVEAGAGVAVLALKDRVGEASVQGKALIFVDIIIKHKPKRMLRVKLALHKS